MLLPDAIKELRDLAVFYRNRGQKERAEAYDHAALIVSKLDAPSPDPSLGLDTRAVARVPGELLGGPKTLNILSNVVRCKKCGHQWTPRTTKIFRCAKCKSPYWNIERVPLPSPDDPEPRDVDRDRKKGA